MIGNLVMDSKRLNTIKALAKNYARIDQHGNSLKAEPWSADFVKGKGTGLNFLLHGSPGTGKTCTAGEHDIVLEIATGDMINCLQNASLRTLVGHLWR